MPAKPLTIYAAGVCAFLATPMMLYAFSDAPFRSPLKDIISILTLVSFSLMLAQFFLARSNTVLLDIIKPPTVQKLHKFLAYGAITVILLHPFLVVLPRYFEGGVSPMTALWEILSNYDNPGVLTGIVAWVVLVVLGVTAYFRKPILKRMDKKYRGWRGLHTVLVLAFVFPAIWHVIDLGRHVGVGFALYFCSALAGGLILLARLYPNRFPARLFLRPKADPQ